MTEHEHNCSCGHDDCDCGERNFVEVVWEDGSVIKCEIYDVIDFEEKTYALLFPMDDDDVEDDEELIVMQYVEEGDEGYFQSIDDEDEFNRVCNYIQTLEEDDEEEE